MKKHILYFLSLVIILSMGCQKEVSFEGSNTPARGALQAELTGDCLPKTVNGAYIAGTALVPATNTISVQVNISRTGSYTVYTDTVNGYFFRATGTFTTLGLNTVELRSSGTPFAAGVNNFVVNFDTTVCDIQVTVLPAGTGPATFTLVSGGTPVNCASAVVSGTYVKDAPLGATHFVDVVVNVTAVGTYTIKATGGGMTFQKTAAFTTTGNQTVRLNGSGTPTVLGANTVTFDPPFASCSFTVTVPGPATFTLVSGGTPVNCASAVVTGTYVKDVPLVPASQYVDITVNVTVVGTYTIKATGGGMIFQKTAAFSATGNQAVRLDGTGTPTVLGANTITFDPPFASCNFTVTVVGPVAGTLGGAGGACAPITVNGTYTQGVALVAGNTVVVQITTPAVGPYSITTNTQAGISFSASGTSNGATQLITLTNNGATPNSSGIKTFTVTFGTSTCTFTINILPPAAGACTPDCSTAIVNGLYEPALQLNCSNTVDIDVNVTSLGPITITTAAVNGMTFTWSGTFTALGIQNITLAGSGTPVTATTSNITVPGPPSCTFPITVTPPFGPIGWKFTVTNAPSTIYAGQFDFGDLSPTPTPGIGMLYTFEGSNSDPNDFFTFGINDISGTINVGETYSSSANPLTTNAAAFEYDTPSPFACSDIYKADPTITGVTMTFTVTFHDAVTHVIRGTFSGTAKNAANQTITITTGTFDGLY
ncbi:MAG: hypothetical protein ABIR30_08745 [Chitinophagaceae bacterium]